MRSDCNLFISMTLDILMLLAHATKQPCGSHTDICLGRGCVYGEICRVTSELLQHVKTCDSRRSQCQSQSCRFIKAMILHWTKCEHRFQCLHCKGLAKQLRADAAVHHILHLLDGATLQGGKQDT